MKKVDNQPEPEIFESTGRYTVEVESCLGLVSDTAGSIEAIRKWAENRRDSHRQWHIENDVEHQKWGEPTLRQCKFTIGPVSHVLRGKTSGTIRWEPVPTS